LLAGSLLQILAGRLLMLGIWPLMLLNFWHQTGDQPRNSITQWQCNLALIGGLLSLAVTTQ
jgi:hypothetical protein